MLVLILSADAFAACPSAFSLDFNSAQYTDCFRDVLRGSEINAGTDLAGTGHMALNFVGSTGSAPSTWLTVYDSVPAIADAGPTFGAETLCADVLIRTAGNVKGAGVVALLNEGAGRKGLAVHISNAGNTDTLVLSTVDGDSAQKGKLTTLTSVSLQGSIVENRWYRVVMTVDPSATPKVTGQVFTHSTPTDPNSGPLTQVGGTLTYNSFPAGVTSPGQNAVIANAIAASVNSSVTNFSNDPVKCGVAGPPPPPPPSTAGFPATGQTTCWDESERAPGDIPNVVPCPGTGQDGEIQAGATLSYTDNGDGTITDISTGLMWEKKTLGQSIHGESAYRWADAFAVHVAGLNAVNFAGHADWRLPNVKELHSLVNHEKFNLAVSSAFDTECVAGCTACSCTARIRYWSSTTYAENPDAAWYVSFVDGHVSRDGKSLSNAVRAVRGGS